MKSNQKNKTLTVFLLFVLCVLQGWAYEWQGEAPAAENFYIYNPTHKVFLTATSTVTSNANEATVFTLSAATGCTIAYKDGNETKYVYESAGNASWGATNSNTWTIASNNGGYYISHTDPAKSSYTRYINYNGSSIDYPRQNFTDNNRTWLLISKDQHDAILDKDASGYILNANGSYAPKWGWTTSGETSTQKDGDYTFFNVGSWWASSINASITQSVTIPAGVYTLTVNAKRESSATLSIGVNSDRYVTSSDNWKEYTLPINANGSAITIGAYATATGEHKWANVDWFKITNLNTTAAWAKGTGNGPSVYSTGIETYRGDNDNFEIGKQLYQTITGLQNGSYTVEFYATANKARGDAVQSGAGKAQVYCNTKTQDISIIEQSSCTPTDAAYLRTFTVRVTDGTLEYGIQNIAAGGNWYVCQPKSITYLGDGVQHYADAFTNGGSAAAAGMYSMAVETGAYSVTASANTTLKYTQNGANGESQMTSVTLTAGEAKNINLDAGTLYFSSSAAATLTFTKLTIGVQKCSVANNDYVQRVQEIRIYFDGTTANYTLAKDAWATITGTNNYSVQMLLLATDDGKGAKFTLPASLTTNATYTLTIPANVLTGDNGQQNEEVTLTLKTPVLFTGNYYLFNLYQAKYMTYGNAWGTQASVDMKYPLLCTIETTEGGKFKINTHYSLTASAYNPEVNNYMYIEGGTPVVNATWGDSDVSAHYRDAQLFNIEPVDEGYNITCEVDGIEKALMFGTGTACTMAELNTPLNIDKAIWKLVTEVEYEVYRAKNRFTVASLNVDGMPREINLTVTKITLNPDAKEADGATAIGRKLKTMGWDVIGVSEDFNFHSEIWDEAWNGGIDEAPKGIYSYNSTTHQEEITVGNANLTNYASKKPLFDTDGLCLFYKKSNVSQDKLESSETMTAWTTHNGYTDDGADGLIKKGFRYYLVQLADDTEFDLYIFHMDAEDSDADNAAREVQITQLVEAIKATSNGRPIILMGDTNCRYTRDRLKTLLIDAINADARFTIHDAWVENGRGGIYPAYGSWALSQTDLGYRKGEVVDKIFWINNTESNIRIQPVRFYSDLSFINEADEPLADHWPGVCEFEYHTYDPAVDDKEVERLFDPDLTYYIRNKENGKFLKGGGQWASHAVTGNYGKPMTIQQKANGKYEINTGVGYLTQDDPYTDGGSAVEWEIVRNGAYYNLKYSDGAKALTSNDPATFSDGCNTRYVTCADFDAESDYQMWEIISEAELNAEMKKADEAHPFNCTYLFKDANFDRGYNNTDPNWTFSGGSSRCNYNVLVTQDWETVQSSFLNRSFANPNAEVYCDDNSGKSNWTLTHKTLTGLPNGLYKVTFQAFFRDGDNNESTTVHTLLYANSASTDFKPISSGAQASSVSSGNETQLSSGSYVPTNITGAADFFNKGLYLHELECEVTDGTLSVSLSHEHTATSSWSLFDNFQIYYLGKLDGSSDEEEELQHATLANASFGASIPAKQTVEGNADASSFATWAQSASGMTIDNELADVANHVTTLNIDCSKITEEIASVSVYANTRKLNIVGDMSYTYDAENPTTTISNKTVSSPYCSDGEKSDWLMGSYNNVATVFGADNTKKYKVYLLPVAITGGVKVTVRTSSGKFYTQNFADDIAAGAKKSLAISEETVTAGPKQLWMTTIPGNTYFSMVTIPGAHDAASSAVSGTFSGYAQTQTETIEGLLANGVRAFDMRPGYYLNETITADNLYIYHGSYNCNVLYKDAIAALVNFVKDNPSEAIIVTMVKENNGTGTDRSTEMYNILNALHDSYSSYFKVLNHTNYNLDDFRGKICYITRNDWSHGTVTKISDWPDDATVSDYSAKISGLGLTSIQDQYNSNGTTKQTAVKNMMEMASANTDYKKFHINFSSSAYKLAGSSPSSYASATNPVITTYLNDGNISGPAGYVFGDYMGSSDNGGAAYLTAIINQNYRYVYNGRSSEELLNENMDLHKGSDVEWTASGTWTDAHGTANERITYVTENYSGWANLDQTDFSLLGKKYLPKGTYKMTAYSLYGGTEGNAKMVAKRGSETMSSVNVTAKGTLNDQIAGRGGSDDLKRAANTFGADAYVNTLYFSLTEPTLVTLGFEGTHTAAQQWFVAGPVTLTQVQSVAASEEQPVDITGWIKNPQIKESTQTACPPGWSVANRVANNSNYTTSTGDTQIENWHPTAGSGNFDYYQILNLPAGKYTLGADMLYRNGGADQVGLYASGAVADSEKKVAVSTIDATMHTYSLDFTSTGGDVRIGVKRFASMTGDWFAADNFTLKALGGTAATEAQKADLASAITTAAARKLGFEVGQYAPYTNVEGLAMRETVLASAKAINTSNTTESEINWAIDNLNEGWIKNTKVMDAIYDGDFSETAINDNLNGAGVTGWTTENLESMRRVTDKNHFTSGHGLYAWPCVLKYGEQTGYTMPLEANTVYRFSMSYGGWEGSVAADGPSVSILCDETGMAATHLGAATVYTEGVTKFLQFFKTGNKAGNYTLTYNSTANGNTVIGDLSLTNCSSVARTSAKGKFGTICLPYNFTVTGADLYTINSIDGTNLKMQKVESGVAGTPYIYYATADAQTFSYAESGNVVQAPTAGSNGLIGAFKLTAVPTDSYVLQTQKDAQNKDVQAFYKVDGSKTINCGVYKAYLTPTTGSTTGSNARAFYFSMWDDEDTDGMNTVESLLNGDGKIYDLQGRQHSRLQKGINIVNGKRILVK